MEIETYEVGEVTATGVESASDPEALKLIESLGLSGQQKFVKSDGSGVQTRAPYRLMTTTEHRVYSILLPDRQELSQYDGQMIPLRVLQVAAHAKEIDMFKRIEIWHAEGTDDPLLVGRTDVHDWRRAAQHEAFILARWGTELKPLEELIGEAKAKLASMFKAVVSEALARLGQINEHPEISAETYLRSGKWPDSILLQLQ